MIGFHDVILVKTGGLTVLLFLFFLLLGFNHFVEEGLAKAVDVIHALLGKAPKIKVLKKRHHNTPYSIVFFGRFAFLFPTVFLERLCRVAAKGRLGTFF